MVFDKVKPLNKLFSQAGDKYCDEDGCYIGTCPVNCLAFLFNQHIKKNIPFLIFGDYLLLQRLAKQK